ncbi:MAG: type II toxin-antitoxin system VapC family toxin [Gammaproteobacteria bacterium]|nr:type II toxin-antitoxin system VapC family toxin [Gammaproteobacteria bacterium]
MGLIYLDTCLLIYAVESHPVFGSRVMERLARARPARFAISPLTMLECLVKPMREADLALQRRYEGALAQLEELPLPGPVYRQAAELRAHFGLKTPDALHLACAQHHGCDALWTNDDRLTAAGHGLAHNLFEKLSRDRPRSRR